MTKYYTMTVRRENGRYEPEFGDFDRAVVEDEARYYRDQGETVHILSSAPDQASVTAAIERHNRNRAPASVNNPARAAVERAVDRAIADGNPVIVEQPPRDPVFSINDVTRMITDMPLEVLTATVDTSGTRANVLRRMSHRYFAAKEASRNFGLVGVGSLHFAAKRLTKFSRRIGGVPRS